MNIEAASLFPPSSPGLLLGFRTPRSRCLRQIPASSPWVIALWLVLAFAGLAPAAPLQIIKGHVPAATLATQPVGEFSGTNYLHLAISLPLRNHAELTNLLAQIYNPASASYHHFLTPAQFAERFGPASADYESLRKFMTANGLTETGTHGNRVVLDVAGTVSQINEVFHVQLRLYPHPRESRNFFAPDTEPSVDLGIPILHISGLDNFVVPHPMSLHKRVQKDQSWAGSGTNGSYIGKDFRKAYVPHSVMTGLGQTVGLLQLESGFYQSDITLYENQAGLPNVPVNPVLLDGYNGGPGFANDECSLDIEMALSMAPGLSQILVYEGLQPDSILAQMASDGVAMQLSSSYSFDVDSGTDPLFEQFQSQGQSFYNASGDDNAWVNGVDYPSDDPNITIVGGTTLTTSATGAWMSEKVWNWNITNGSGGGISTTYSIPWWQQGVDMTLNQGSTSMRDIPDVALTADNVYVTYGDGTNGIFGGTSCASPLWAGFTALMNQQAVNNGVSPVGFVNPAIYNLGAETIYTNVFHDITVGDNTNNLSDNLFFAVPGYDLCTGWGTPAGQSLIDAMVGPASPTPAYIITQPTNETVIVGATATFSVVAGGLPPFGYQWTLNGTNLPGATNSILVQADVQTNETGGYYMVEVTNQYGSTYSSTVVLTVNPPFPCLPGPSGMVGWWAGEGNANDTLGTNNGILNGGISFSTGEVGEGFFYGDSTDDVRIPASTNLDVGDATGSFTVEAWINCSTTSKLNPIFEWNKGDGVTLEGVHFYAWSDGSLYANLINKNNVGQLVQTSGGLITPGTFHHVALTYDQTTGLGTIYCDGNLVAQVGVGQFTPQTSYDLYLGCRPTPQGNTYTFSGVIDEATLYNRALTSQEIQNIYGAGSSGKCLPNITTPPSILSQPTNEAVAVLATARFGVGAVGAAPLQYQWVFDTNNPIAGATNSILTLTNVQLNQAGTYSVMVANGFGSLQSANAWLTVTGIPPAIVVQPVGFSVTVGTTTQLVATASGTPPLSCQWKLQGTNLPGATNLSFSLTNAQVSQSGTYVLQITNLFGSTLSSNAVVTVHGVVPSISSQPVSQSVEVGSNVMFGVIAVGTAPLAYQWKLQGTNLPAATNTTLQITNVQFQQAGIYTVAVTNAFGSTLSSNASLGVISGSACVPAPPGFVSWWPGSGNALDLVGSNNGVLDGVISFTNGEVGQGFYYPSTNADVRIPASASLNVGTNNSGLTLEAWISCANISQPNPIFEWNQGNGTTAPGMQFYVFPNGSLYCNVVNTGGAYNTYQTAVGLISPGVFYHVALTYNHSNGSLVIYLNGSVVGQNALGQIIPQTSYSLYLGRRPLTGGAAYTFAGIIDEPSIYGRALAQNEIQAIYAAGTGGKCPPPPVFLTNPTNLSAKVGSTATFVATVAGANVLGYQWYRNTNIALLGATNATLILTNVQMANAGTYALFVTNAYGSAVSSNVVLSVHLQDHFAWSLIPSPRFVNVPFTATITAQNASNSVVTNFTGAVSLASTSGVSIFPSTSAAFVRGAWTGSITVGQVASNLVLQANDGLGDIGLANPINVAAEPVLNGLQSSPYLLLFWPTNIPGFVVQTAPKLNSTNWVPMNTGFGFANSNAEIITIGKTNAFFRLWYTNQ